MKLTIAKKLFLILMLTSLVILGLSSGLNRWSFERGFLDYLNTLESQELESLAADLSTYYQVEGSWDILRDDPSLWMSLTTDTLPPELARVPKRRPGAKPGGRDRRPPSPENHPPPPPPVDPLAVGPRLTLLDMEGVPVAGRPDLEPRSRRIPVMLGDVQIGELAVAPLQALTEQIDVQFAEQQTRSAYVIAAIVLMLAGVAAYGISRQLTLPIKALAAGAKSMTAGRYDEQIRVAAQDELGQLADDFNVLGSTLNKNRIARQQWIADIAHELRTPLAILQGELQAIEDGVRTFDDGAFKSLQAEVTRLSQLVRDLHELSLSDEGGLSYERRDVDLREQLEDATDTAARRLKQTGLDLQLHLPDHPILVYADPARLKQLFANLIENSIRYTQAPGQLRIVLKKTEDQAWIVFSDSPPSVPYEAMPRLFDRLYRVETSRNRVTGGSGLGLSICQAIVAGHSGTITARASELGGLSIEIMLPLRAG